MVLDGALSIFAEIRDSFGLPVVTDAYGKWHCACVAEPVDVLQILASFATGAASATERPHLLVADVGTVEASDGSPHSL
jgi:3-deoxy-D-manno-octulosonic acid (KDO) 8-phosphate synthase